jgi:hypothetical protein
MEHPTIGQLKKHLILVPIILVGTMFRIWELTKIGLRGDEVVYAGQALILAGHHEMTRFFVLFSRGTSNFLLHQSVQALCFYIFGVSDFVVRIVPVMFSLLTIIVVYAISREIFDKEVASLSAFLLAINGYAVSLGRLALLDSTMTFFFSLSMFWLARWIITEKSKWIYLLACTAGIAVLVKVTAILVFPISFLTIVFCKKTNLLNTQIILRSAIAFLISMIPAILQITSNFTVFSRFILGGTSRVSSVPMTYYIDKLLVFAGPVFLVFTILGISVAFFLRKKGDVMCIIWIGTVFLFFQLYPLKGFNYILPLVPVASIISGRGLASLAFSLKKISTIKLKKISSHKIGFVSILVLILSFAAASYSMGYSSIYDMVYDRPFVSLREASYWLRDNVSPESSVMTISQGSAQYVISYYANIDAYPFGNFRLHTILPGNGIIFGAPPPDPLIQNGTITYLVHYVSWGGDDPIHMPAKSSIEEDFIDLIQKYQGNLLHVVYHEFISLDGTKTREARVWIYKVGKRLSEPSVEINLNNSILHLQGNGFLIDSYVDIYYGSAFLGRFQTDNIGSFNESIDFPQPIIPNTKLTITDVGRNKVVKVLESENN